MVVSGPEGSPVKGIKFLAAMPEEECKKYRGEWLAVASGEIVAHGRDPRRTLTEGCRAGKGMPPMEYAYADSTEAPFPCYDPGWRLDAPAQERAGARHAGIRPTARAAARPRAEHAQHAAARPAAAAPG